MTKCDFCTKSMNGKCWWTLQVYAKEKCCLEAIKRMTEALKNVGING